jgi:Zn-dependent protease
MFRLLGFDVHVRTGFLIFLGLIVFLYQDAFGVWLAGALAFFTLLHELGHAVAARSAGAYAEISLDFLAGYTSFRPDPARPLSRGRRALISASGPGVQIVTSVLVLAAMGVNAFSLDSVRDGSEVTAAIWWAGPAIGALNLIPVLPLDGGHLALTAIEGALKERAMRAMVIASLVITGTGAAYMFLTGRGGFGIFIAFLLFSQFQMFQATGSKRARGPQRSTDAESVAWQTGKPGILEPGQRLSPWFEAHRALLQGDPGGAMGVMLADLRSAGRPRWAPPTAATPQQLRAVVDVLPRDLPAGNAYSSAILADVLLALGEHQRAGEYAASAFGQLRHWQLATAVARAAAALGDRENAVRWLAAAEDAATDDGGPTRRALALVVDRSPEFSGLRGDADFAAVRSRLAA